MQVMGVVRFQRLKADISWKILPYLSIWLVAFGGQVPTAVVSLLVLRSQMKHTWEVEMEGVNI
jgi:hypothetical protein